MSYRHGTAQPDAEKKHPDELAGGKVVDDGLDLDTSEWHDEAEEDQ